MSLSLLIGSGMNRERHRHVLQARLKKAGTAWLPDDADPMPTCASSEPMTNGSPLELTSPAFNHTQLPVEI